MALGGLDFNRVAGGLRNASDRAANYNTYYRDVYGPEGRDSNAPWGYQEHTNYYLTDFLPRMTGLTQWMEGGRFDPMGSWTTELADAMVGDPAQVSLTPAQMQAARMGMPSSSEAMRYGQSAMDLASRSAAQQAGFAAQSLGPGLSGAGRAAALGNIAQQAASGAGSAGVQGYLGGLSALTSRGQTNAQLAQQAALQNAQFRQQSDIEQALANAQFQQQAMLTEAGISQGLTQQALDQMFGTSQLMYGTTASSILQQQMQRAQARAQRRRGFFDYFSVYLNAAGQAAAAGAGATGQTAAAGAGAA